MSVQLGDYRLGAVKQCEHDAFDLGHIVEKNAGIIDHALNVVEVAARRESPPDSRKNHHVGIGVRCKFGEKTRDFRMCRPADRVERGRAVERGTEQSAAALELESRVASQIHGLFSIMQRSTCRSKRARRAESPKTRRASASHS